jgi:hypothetical protein
MRLALRLRLWIVACVVLAMPLGALLEPGGDCDFALEAGAGGACLHGHDDAQDEQPGRCPPDHHGAARCGCTCHHAGILIAPGRLAAPPPSGFVGRARPDQLLWRRDAPPLRPPIAG